MPNEPTSTLLAEILANADVQSVYQPVISLRKKRTIFEEALGRGKSHDGTLLSPLPLLDIARKEGRLHELDRLFLNSAIAGWAPRSTQGILSVNIDTSCIGPHSLPWLHRKTSEHNIQASRIILEICENRSQSPEELNTFVREARALGFLIAIDDLGKEHSNLDRIISLAPDLIKLDRDLIEQIHTAPHKRALVRSIVRFGEECRALVVAEGVECWEEAFCLMELGIDLYQGYYFAHPNPVQTPRKHWLSKTEILGRSFRVHRTNALRKQQEFRNLLHALSNKSCEQLSKQSADEFDRMLAHYANRTPHIECLYILDSWGEQITRTHFSRHLGQSPRSSLFEAGSVGEDHSLKDYFLNLPPGSAYLSESYLSQASGNPCHTFSRWFPDCEGSSFVLCIDLPVQTVSNLRPKRKNPVETQGHL